MFLADSAIQHAIDRGSLRIEGLAPIRVQPSSVELHLGDEFKWWTSGGEIDPLDPPAMYSANPKRSGHDWFLLEPKQFMLGHTVETVGVDSTLAAQVDGKSSLARLGLQVHMTSGFVDPGFEGQITLELFNAAPKPIRLRPGMVIAQLFIIPMWGPVQRPYGSAGVDSRYQGQTGATASLYGQGRVPAPAGDETSDMELPGMWESADFTGGADETRPRRKARFGEHADQDPTAPLTQAELRSLTKNEIDRRLSINGGRITSTSWDMRNSYDRKPGRDA